MELIEPHRLASERQRISSAEWKQRISRGLGYGVALLTLATLGLGAASIYANIYAPEKEKEDERKKPLNYLIVANEKGPFRFETLDQYFEYHFKESDEVAYHPDLKRFCFSDVMMAVKRNLQFSEKFKCLRSNELVKRSVDDHVRSIAAHYLGSCVFAHHLIPKIFDFIRMVGVLLPGPKSVTRIGDTEDVNFNMFFANSHATEVRLSSLTDAMMFDRHLVEPWWLRWNKLNAGQKRFWVNTIATCWGNSTTAKTGTDMVVQRLEKRLKQLMTGIDETAIPAK